MKSFIPFFIVTTINILAGQAFCQTDTLGMHERLKQTVLFLASDSMKGRSTGTPEELYAGRYFLEQTAKYKHSKTCKWTFKATKKDSVVVTSTMYGRFINNHSNYTLLVGAHIDHIGYGDNLSLSHRDSGIHNGADDNASGVAALIEMHNYLATKKLPFNLLFVPFTAHEVGTFGSAYLANHLPRKVKNLFCMINLDMIGRMDPAEKKLYIAATDSLFKNQYSTFLNLSQTDNKRLFQLDCKHFVTKGIPTATFTTGVHVDYHKISDDEKYINYNGIIATTLFLENWISESATNLLPHKISPE